MTIQPCSDNHSQVPGLRSSQHKNKNSSQPRQQFLPVASQIHKIKKRFYCADQIISSVCIARENC